MSQDPIPRSPVPGPSHAPSPYSVARPPRRPAYSPSPQSTRPIPSINIHQAHAAGIAAESVKTPNNVSPTSGEVCGRSPSAPSTGSPPSPMVMSVHATPVVPPSASHVRWTSFSGSPSTTAGSKRTASGSVKAPPVTVGSASVPTSPTAPVTPSIPRSQSSLDAGSRNVSELSTQLRARLTYALLKVQNNWTTESLDQVEARLLQGHHAASPTGRMRVKRESSAEDLGNFRRPRTSSEPSLAHPLAQSYPPSGEAGGRTYESFWREHEPNPIAKKILQARAASAALGSTTGTNTSMPDSLSREPAPSPFAPERSRRTPYNPQRPPPRLSQAGSSTFSNASTIPDTPPHSAAQRTMEQDAVESLMFLSSPGNSRHMGPNPTPLEPPIMPPTVAPSRLQPPESDRHSYGRNATTWPTGRHRAKQARTSLEGIGLMDSGVVVDEDLTDVEEDNAGSSQETVVQGVDVSPRRGGVSDAYDSPERHRGSGGARTNAAITSLLGSPR